MEQFINYFKQKRLIHLMFKLPFSSSTAASRIDDDVNEDDDLEEEEDEDNEDVAASDEKPKTKVQNDSTTRSTPGYVNIRRTRPTTTTTEPSRLNFNAKIPLF